MMFNLFSAKLVEQMIFFPILGMSHQIWSEIGLNCLVVLKFKLMNSLNIKSKPFCQKMG